MMALLGRWELWRRRESRWWRKRGCWDGDAVPTIMWRLGPSRQFQGMPWWIPGRGGMQVDEVHRGFGSAAKIRWALRPAHGQCEWERDERVLPGAHRKGHTQRWDILCAKADAVKAVGEVQLEHVGGTIPRVCCHDALEDADQGLSKLHGLCRRSPFSLLVDPGEGVVHYGLGPSFALRDHAHWGQSEVG